ncbi:MAG: PAS domain S-box protein, partial [Flavobacteriales bacterium]|nr:PAS domain S-box protein [Flavobacteriales bacterium]
MDLKHFEELTQTAVWELDTETGCFYWSDCVFEMLGEAPQSFKVDQNTFQNRIFEDDRFRWQKALDQSLRGGPEINLDKRLINASGDFTWVNVRAKLHVSGGSKKLVGVYADISAEKQRQRNLQLIEKVNANVDYAIVILESIHGKYHETGIAYINQGFTKITGYTFSDAKGQTLDLLVENAKDRGKILRNKEPTSLDCEILTKQGDACKIRWTFTPLETEGLLLGLGLNITDQKSPEILLEDAANAARIGSWEADFQNQKIYWSPTTYEIHEMESEDLADIKSANTFYHPDYRDRIMKMSENGVKKNKAFEYEAPIITAEGNNRWVKVMAIPKVKEGKCIGLYGSIQDIHQRKVVELELQRSVKELEDYKFAMDQSAILAITDAKGVILDVNQNFCKIAQYERHEIIGKTHRLINSGYHGSAFFREFWKTISSGKVWKGEIKNKAKDGSFYWVYTTVVPFMDTDGKPNRYLAARFDITSRKEADQKLLSILREKNTILESIGDAFFAVDHNWVVTYWNKKAEEILIRDRSEIEGKVLWDVYADAVDTKFYTEYHKAVETGRQTSFEAFYDKLGLWLEVSAYPNEKGLSIYFRDISMRKKFELSLIESRERFQKVTQATNDAIWDWDFEKGEVFWGIGFKTLFGYKTGTRKVESSNWTSAIHPDDRENTVKSLDNAIADPRRINYLTEYRFQKSDGTYAYVTDRSVI